MRIVDNIVDELLTSSCVMRRTFVVKVDRVDKKIDIRTKKYFGLTVDYAYILYIYMTTMSTIRHGYMVLSVNFSSTTCQHVNNPPGYIKVS